MEMTSQTKKRAPVFIGARRFPWIWIYEGTGVMNFADSFIPSS